MQGSVLLSFRSSFHVYDAMTNLSIVEKQYSTGEELEEKVRVYQETNMERLWSSTLPPPRNMLSSLGSAGSCRTLPGEWKALTFPGCIWISYQATRGSWTIHGRGEWDSPMKLFLETWRAQYSWVSPLLQPPLSLGLDWQLGKSHSCLLPPSPNFTEALSNKDTEKHALLHWAVTEIRCD